MTSENSEPFYGFENFLQVIYSSFFSSALCPPQGDKGPEWVLSCQPGWQAKHPTSLPHTHQPHKINKTKICFHQAFCNSDHKRFGSPRVQSLCHLAGVPSFLLRVTNASPHLTHNSPTHFQSLPNQKQLILIQIISSTRAGLALQGMSLVFRS